MPSHSLCDCIDPMFHVALEAVEERCERWLAEEDLKVVLDVSPGCTEVAMDQFMRHHLALLCTLCREERLAQLDACPSPTVDEVDLRSDDPVFVVGFILDEFGLQLECPVAEVESERQPSDVLTPVATLLCGQPQRLPFLELHVRQSVSALARVLSPPKDRGTLWSTVRSSRLPQFEHHG